MEFSAFWATVGAVIFGNGVSLLFVYALWSGSQSEKRYGDMSRVPLSVLLCGMLAPLIGGISIFFAVSW